jgi:hypothetical protein
MFILFVDINTQSRSVAERKAQSTPLRMRNGILRDVAPILGSLWPRTHVCNMYLCQRIDGRLNANRLVEGIWEARHERAYITVNLSLKSPMELQADQRRLAVAMAFHSRLGVGSLMGCLDALALDHIVWLAGPSLV